MEGCENVVSYRVDAGRPRPKLKWHDIVESPLTIIASAIAILSSLLLPLSHDIRMYQAAAYMADYYGGLPSGIDTAWEIKPIGSRFFHYMLYKLGSIFATFSSSDYEFAIKIIAIVMTMVMCGYFASKINKPFAFILTFLPVVAVYNQAILQPEWFAVPMALVAIALFTEKSRTFHALAGVMITAIFFMKGITIFLVIPICLSAYLIAKPDTRESLARLCVGGAASALSLIYIILTGWFPRMIPDMLMSSTLARIGYFNPFAMLQNFIYGFFGSYAAVYIPAILVGIAAFLWIASENEDWQTTAILGVSWVVCLFIVFAQSENVFVYQYIVLVIPAIMSLQFLNDNLMKAACIVMILGCFIAFSAAGISQNAFVEKEYTLKQRAALSNLTDSIPDIRGQDTLLYLDIGDAPYFLQRNSSCRYINSLPFERNEKVWNISYLPQYQENLNCIMTYNGKYIIAAEIDRGDGKGRINWMKQDTNDNAMVFNKIETEYTRVWDDAWIVYQRNITQ